MFIEKMEQKCCKMAMCFTIFHATVRLKGQNLSYTGVISDSLSIFCTTS